jgi:hypothetical protein
MFSVRSGTWKDGVQAESLGSPLNGGGESLGAREMCRRVAMKAAPGRSARDMRDSFKDLARAGMLYPDDAMTLTYLLCGIDDDRGFFAGNILRRHSQQRPRRPPRTQTFHSDDDDGRGSTKPEGVREGAHTEWKARK